MTLLQDNRTPEPAVIDGIDVDAVAAAVAGSAGVTALDGGPFGAVATYLPGRKVTGVVIGNGRVKVQVRSRWGVPAADLAASITAALAPLTGHRPVDVVIADIDDPPLSPSFRVPDGPPWPEPGLPPV
ncbi:MAG: hypothetical protein JO132_16345 [Streptosporangiaceae bacterium]|nr:hypothetical protein [Streptosporangiaceae bacterium]